MKKITLTIITLLTITLAQSQNVNIPDVNFKAYLVGNTSINTDNDSEISTVEATAFTGTINCSTKSINDLTGIEHFVNLTRLNCDFNKITSLDVSSNLSITRLECDFNRLISLNLGNNTNLTYLDCDGNKLETLNLLNISNLETLECSNNNLTSINLSNNTKLESLDIFGNDLSILDVSSNLVIRDISCETNIIENIDISLNTKLTSLDCRNNNLESLNLDNGKTLFFNLLKASGNSNLTCIQVDDLGSVRTSTWDYDASVSFSTDCQYALSVNDFLLDAKITIYPNPANQLVSIESKKTIDVLKIYTISGALIKTVLNPAEINVSNLSKGTYFFALQIGDEQLTKKILLK